MIDPEISLPLGLLAKGYLLHLKRLVRILTGEWTILVLFQIVCICEGRLLY